MDRLISAPCVEDERLAAYGEAAARLLRAGEERSARPACRALRRQLGEIRRCREAVQRRYGALPSPPAACEWLLDNAYLALREGRAAYLALRGSRPLRAADGEPLILALCRSLLHAGHGAVTAERCRIYLEGFQRVTPLRRRELLLFPAALRAVCVEALAEVCRALPYAADMTEHAKAFEALFGTLRLLGVLDMEKLLDEADATGAALAAEAAGVYPQMDRGTKRA